MTARYEVSTELMISVRVKVMVEAVSKEDAIDAIAALMPNNSDDESRRGWSAKVEIKAPKGVELTTGAAYHLQQASGGDKARKVSR